MKATLAALLLSTSALAADDAPKRVDAGVSLTVTGPALVYNEAQSIDLANRLQAAESRPAWGVVVAAGAVGLVVGAVVAGVVVATAKK